MKRIGILIGCMIGVSLSARPLVNPISQPLGRPEIASGTGGPDAYGYTWIDSDTTAPGAPTYNWIDITNIGTKVKGLGDDNTQGPFDIGFDFPYYWYKVNKFYVCSNGAISFSDDDVWISHEDQTNGQIPYEGKPNDVVAPLGGDLKFTPSRGEVYYYTNDKDTLIVSYIDVPEWHRDVPGEIYGSHTFQIILTKGDSSITFQYGSQDGDFHYDTDVPVTSAIGIENNTGTIGLQYLRNNSPEENMFHEGLAIKIIPPETTTYEVRDVAVTDVMSEGSRGVFAHINQKVPLWAKIKNVGNQSMSDITVECKIEQWGMAIFEDTAQISSLKPGEVKEVRFNSWREPDPSLIGTYSAVVVIYVSGDMQPANDYGETEIVLVEYPTWLSYWEEGTTVSSTSFGVNSGMGVKFTPPSYPVDLDTVAIYLADSLHPTNMALHIYKDDGPGGLPGTILWADTFAIPDEDGAWRVGFYAFSISPSIKIESGSFYVVGIQIEEGFLVFFAAADPPYSRQSWEVLDGTFAPYRGNEEGDVVISAFVKGRFGMEEKPKAIEVPLSLMVMSPNPLKDKSLISFTTSYKDRVNLSIYDPSGRLVENLIDGNIESGTHKIVWDSRRYPSGVYFLNLKFSNKSLTKKLVLVK